MADLTKNSDQRAGQIGAGAQVHQMEALRRAVSGVEEHQERSNSKQGRGAVTAIERVREFADALRTSDQRISDLEARVSAEAARADAAERRAEEAEDRLNEMMIVIQEELAPGRSGRG